MQPLTSALCLGIWERGRPLRDLDRALLVLSYAVPERAPDEPADWPLGRRNQALLDLYRCSFGRKLEAECRCANCGEEMEMELDAEEMLTDRAADWPETLAVAGHVFRLPSSRALASVARKAADASQETDFADATAPGLLLLDACRVAGQEPLTLSPEELSAVEQAMTSADPLAELRLSLTCPECGEASEQPIDVMTFVWEKIEAQARALLSAVHLLASAYGWNEREVLALSEVRRRLYLEMLEGSSSLSDQRERSSLAMASASGRHIS